MSLLSKLLSRLPAMQLRSRPRGDVADLESSIGNTIRDALASAGLAPGAPFKRAPKEDHPSQDRFSERTFTNQAGTRLYKLYLPIGYTPQASRRYPLVIMLHGCTQSPDDFAEGTRMNALADKHGFLVAYPAQSKNANGSKCWNWFRPQDQARAAGEPAILAGMVLELIGHHAVDPSRVFVAGLSAGAAMAVILGETYPELFAAVGAHSGLPYGSASDVPSAFAAMAGTGGRRAALDLVGKRPNASSKPVVPMIIFHGDRDRTVVPSNGEHLVRQVVGSDPALSPKIEISGAVEGGRSYTRSIYTTALGEPLAEYWNIHGGGHAWSGGSASGSYTDPGGPDASVEMMRFFLDLPNKA